MTKRQSCQDLSQIWIAVQLPVLPENRQQCIFHQYYPYEAARGSSETRL